MNSDLLRGIADKIISRREKMPAGQSLLAGISGIDASGKGFITARLKERLQNKKFEVAAINADGWLNLPHVRFGRENPGEHFYNFGLRLEEMFENLVLPLRAKRSIRLTADFAEESAAEFRRHEYVYENIDIILLEGIFLFKKEFGKYFDLKIWIECSFETALERAIARAQENLPPEETVRAYRSIYFPAQKIHFRRDAPRETADLVFINE